MATQDAFKVLIFSKTAAYRHASIPAGIRAIQKLGSTSGFSTDASEDASIITATNLAQYAVVIFLQTSGDFLNEKQLESLKSYVRSGKGFVGIHGASSGLKNVPWYGELVGAQFTDHPKPQNGILKVENRDHFIVSGLPGEWAWFDEWYNFRSNPRQKVSVLISIDEAEYDGGTMGSDHPIAWCREFEGGRTFYTSLGHFEEAYEDATFLSHILNGILWVARKS